MVSAAALVLSAGGNVRTPSGYLRLPDVQRQVAEICGSGPGTSLVDMPQQVRDLKDDGDETRRLCESSTRNSSWSSRLSPSEWVG